MMFALVNISSLETTSSEHVTEGNQITLPCRNKLGGPMRWMYTKSIDSPQNVLFNGVSIESKYVDRITARVDQTSGNYNLLLNNVRLNQSGLYICVEDWAVIYKHSMQLNVLGEYHTLKTCQFNMHNQLLCTISYFQERIEKSKLLFTKRQ